MRITREAVEIVSFFFCCRLLKIIKLLEDLSSHSNIRPFRQKLVSECPAMIGTIPVYDSIIHYQRDLVTLTARDFIDVVGMIAAHAADIAKHIPHARDIEDSCSMCGKFCAIRSMNKAIAGEYIDIL